MGDNFKKLKKETSIWHQIKKFFLSGFGLHEEKEEKGDQITHVFAFPADIRQKK